MTFVCNAAAFFIIKVCYKYGSGSKPLSIHDTTASSEFRLPCRKCHGSWRARKRKSGRRLKRHKNGDKAVKVRSQYSHNAR